MVIQVIKTFFVQFCIFLPSLDLLGLLYQKKRGDIFLSPNGLGASQVMLVVKNLPANAGEIKDVGSIPGSGKIPGGGHRNPLQYSCLENEKRWQDYTEELYKKGLNDLDNHDGVITHLEPDILPSRVK